MPLLLFSTALLPGFVTAPGATNCMALPLIYGPVCVSDTAVSGSPGHKIEYTVDVSGSTQICCKAYYCKGSSCDLHDIGCGTGQWPSGSLNWGDNLATPKMKCKGNVLGSQYSFTH